MEKISTNISKKVISLGSGNVVGYVIDVLFDEKLNTIEGFLVVDDESEEPFFLSIENIKSNSEECFVISDEQDLQLYLLSLYNNPIGKMVYDEHGLNLGKVIDVYFDKKSVKRIVTNKCEFPIQYLQKTGNDCLIFGKAKKRKDKKVLFEIKPNLPSVKIQEQDRKKSKEYPIKLFSKNDLLLGKRVTRQVLGLNHELIAKENDIVTKNIIQKAKLHNRLNLLMFYTK